MRSGGVTTKPYYLLFLVLVVTLLAQPVYAENVTVSFSDLQMGRNLNIQVYQPTVTGAEMIGELNSTGSIVLNTDYDYMFVIKPTDDVWFQNPMNGLELLKAEMPVYLTYLMYVFVLFGGFYVVFRRL